MDKMDEFLDGNEQPAEPNEVEQEQETPETPQEQETATSGPDRGTDGKFKAKGEKEDAPPASDEKAKGLEAGIAAERKKRQEWEDRYRSDVESLRKELETLKQPKEPEAPPPSMWEDENAWQQHFGGQVVNTAVQQATMNAKLDMSEMMARQSHEDFDAMKERFVKMMQDNPALQQQALNDPHPWNRAYQIAKNTATMEELGATDIESLKAQLLEQIKAEQAGQKPQIPQSLAGEQSARGSATAPDNGPPSLNDILKG